MDSSNNKLIPLINRLGDNSSLKILSDALITAQKLQDKERNMPIFLNFFPKDFEMESAIKAILDNMNPQGKTKMIKNSMFPYVSMMVSVDEYGRTSINIFDNNITKGSILPEQTKDLQGNLYDGFYGLRQTIKSVNSNYLENLTINNIKKLVEKASEIQNQKDLRVAAELNSFYNYPHTVYESSLKLLVDILVKNKKEYQVKQEISDKTI